MPKSKATNGVVLGGLALAFACGLRAGRSDNRADDPAPQPAEAKPVVDAPASVSSRRRPPRKLLVPVAIAVALAVAAGIAIAAWTITGSGSGYAKATSASALTIEDASASTTADLFPGATGSVKLKVTNPNSFPVRITTVNGNGAITSDKGAACNASTGVSFTNQSALALDLAAGATSTFTLAGAVAMTNASDDSCQGAVFSIPVTVTGTSNA